MEESMVAGHQITKLLGVKDWFVWNGRKFNLRIVCEILCEPMPKVGELERDANMGCTHVAKLFWPGMTVGWMEDFLQRHDEIFNRELEEMRNGNIN